MSIIPLDVQRRCERRWAAQFSRPTESESVAPRNQGPEHEGEVKRGPRPKQRSKGTWYVSFEPKERLPGPRGFMRKTETFRSEQDAKAFAKATLADSSNINAGTLNPHQPKRIITSAQISDWLDEPDH